MIECGIGVVGAYNRRGKGKRSRQDRERSRGINEAPNVDSWLAGETVTAIFALFLILGYQPRYPKELSYSSEWEKYDLTVRSVLSYKSDRFCYYKIHAATSKFGTKARLLPLKGFHRLHMRFADKNDLSLLDIALDHKFPFDPASVTLNYELDDKLWRWEWQGKVEMAEGVFDEIAARELYWGKLP